MNGIPSADADPKPEASPPPGPSGHWHTQLRISRCRGLGYCVIEVHEFDPAAPGTPPTAAYRVYREERGFPVGEAIARFQTLEQAQRYAEQLSDAAPTKPAA